MMRTKFTHLLLLPLMGWAAVHGLATDVGPGRAALAPQAQEPRTGPLALLKPPRMVLLVVIDTLRADHVGPLASVRGLTPRLDALAQESLVFADATSTSSWTLPSMATVFTGLLPTSHGARRMGDSLAESHVTLPEMLRERGYRSLGVVTNGNVSPKLGFAQGFDRYEMPPPETMSGYPGEYPVHDGRAVTTYALSELRRFRAQDPAAPVFLYVHYVDAHDPYQVRPRPGSDPRPRGRFGGSRRQLDAMDRADDLTEKDKERVRWLYRGEVAHSDLWVGRLLDGLREQMGTLDDALVVVTADHGEGLWDHGRRAHGEDLHEEQLRVPLFVRLPGARTRGRVVDGPVSLADVAPTILDVVGAPVPATFQGASLLPLAEGRPRPPGRDVAYAEVEVDQKRLESGRTPSLKIVCDRSTPRPTGDACRTYDLLLDPEERTDVSRHLAYETARAELQGHLRDLTRAYAAAPPPAPKAAPRADLDAGTLENLKALGYVN